MIYSMTGFGLSKQDLSFGAVTVEVKSINSKYFDFNLKASDDFQTKEFEIKSILQETLSRGKISISIHIDSDSENEDLLGIDFDDFKNYYESLEKLSGSVSANTDNLFELAVSQFKRNETGNGKSTFDLESQWSTLKTSIKEAAEDCKRSRFEEGEKLEKELLGYKDKLANSLIEIQSQDPRRIERVKERLLKQLNDFESDVKYDEGRFEQELIFYIERLDITEEIVRLKSHLKYLQDTILDEKETLKGKKLGFIGQEIGREINTIGSKANDAEIQKTVIVMKEELEKIKEQVLNVL
ncbi:MAG: YicC/YloC family endoribonuclease [Bacteroidota bacterium]